MYVSDYPRQTATERDKGCPLSLVVNDPIGPYKHVETASESLWPMEGRGGFGPFVPSEKERILECRRVTDGWMAALGGLVILWMFYTFCQVMGVGDPRRLSHGYDYRGRLCGVDLPNEPYVYWPSHPGTGAIDLISPICIKQCPTRVDVDNGVNISYPNRTITTENLPDGRKITHITVQAIDVPVYPSRKFGGEYCFPIDMTKSQYLTRALGLTDEWMVITRVFKSIQSGWFFLVASGLLAVVISFGYLFLVADIAWLVCWVTSSMAPLCLLLGSLYLGITSVTMTSNSGIPALVVALDWMPVKGLLVGSAVTGVVISLFLLLSDSHLKQHSRKAVALAQATSHCLWSVPNILVYPVIGTSFAVLIWVIGIFVFIGLLTSPAAVPQAHLVSEKINSSATALLSTSISDVPPSLLSPISEGAPVPSNSIDHLSLFTMKDFNTIDVDNSRYLLSSITSAHVAPEVRRDGRDGTIKSSEHREKAISMLLNDKQSQEESRREPHTTRRLETIGTTLLDDAGSQFGILRQFNYDLGLCWGCLFWALSVLWLLEVIHNLTQFVISLIASMWYFTIPDIRGKRDDIGITGAGCLWVCLRYHLGTLQFSALILSTVRWLQFGAWALRKRMTASTSTGRYQGRIYSVLLGPILGFLKSLEDTSRFLNTGGLMECVLHSNDFLPACRCSWHLLHQQIPSVIILGRVSSALSLLNSVGLASTISGLVLYISNRFPIFHDPSSSWFVDSPAGLAAATFGLVAVIARIVVFSFDQMSSTLLYCFLIESQNQSGVVVFAPDELRVLIEEQESERRLEDLQRAVPDRSILSLSMMAASRNPDATDEVLLSNIKGDEKSWKETIQQFKDDTTLYQEENIHNRELNRITQDVSPRKNKSVRTLFHNPPLSTRQQQLLEAPPSTVEMNDVRW